MLGTKVVMELRDAIFACDVSLLLEPSLIESEDGLLAHLRGVDECIDARLIRGKVVRASMSICETLLEEAVMYPAPLVSSKSLRTERDEWEGGSWSVLFSPAASWWIDGRGRAASSLSALFLPTMATSMRGAKSGIEQRCGGERRVLMRLRGGSYKSTNRSNVAGCLPSQTNHESKHAHLMPCVPVYRVTVLRVIT